MSWYTLDAEERPVRLFGEEQFSLMVMEVWPPLKDEIDGYEVSTVFLGLDHSFGDGYGAYGAPVLWETMIFERGDGPHPIDLSEYQERYTSGDDARAGHETTKQYVRDRLSNPTEGADTNDR